MRNSRLVRGGVTMLEIIVVIGVLLILAALLIPAVARVRQAAQRTQSLNNMKQIGLAVHNFHDSFRKMPPAVGLANNQEGSVLFHLLPFIEQDALFRQSKGNSWALAGHLIPIYLDPDDRTLPDFRYQNSFAATNYAGNWMVFKDGTTNLAAIPDGTSNTMMFTTRYQLCNETPNAWAYSALYTWAPIIGYYSTAKFQTQPKQAECDPQLAQALGAGIPVGMADGSVRYANPEISPHTWYLLLDPADGMPLGDDF